MLARDLQNHDVVDACLISLCNHVFNYGENILGKLASNPQAPTYRRQAAVQCLGNCYVENSLAVLLELLSAELDPQLKLTLLKSIAKQDPLSAVHCIQMEAGSDTPGQSRTELLKLTSKILKHPKDSYALVKSATSLARWFLSETDWGAEPNFTKIALQIVYVDEDRWLNRTVTVFESDDWPHVACAAIGLAKCKSGAMDDILLTRLKSLQDGADEDLGQDIPMRAAAAEALAHSLLQRGAVEIDDLLEYPILKRAVGRYALDRRLILQPKGKSTWKGRNYWFSDPVEADGLPETHAGSNSLSIRQEIDLETLIRLLGQDVKQAQGVTRVFAIIAWADQRYKGRDAFKAPYEIILNRGPKDEDAESLRNQLSVHLTKCGIEKSNLPDWDTLLRYKRRIKEKGYVKNIVGDQQKRIADDLLGFLDRWDLV